MTWMALAYQQRRRRGFLPDGEVEIKGRRLLIDLKTIHLSLADGGFYRPASLGARAGNVAERARRVPIEYVDHARRLDDRHHGVDRDDARGGPVLAALRAWPPVLGLIFGAFGEASDEVEELVQEVATRRASAEWRRMGAREEAEARAFILAQLRRQWGCCAVRERARMLLARLPQVGRPSLAGSRSAAAGRLRADGGDEVASAEAFQSAA